MHALIITGADEVFHLHLLELARAEDEVAGRDFVVKGFSDLRDAERNFSARGCQDIQKVYEDALRCFRSKIDERIGIILSSRADVRVKHEIERARFSPISFTTVRAL